MTVEDLTLPDDPGPAKREPQPIVAAYASMIELGVLTTKRSLSSHVGPSQLGWVCDRRLAYKLHNTPAINIGDPMKLLAGIGVHLALADIFAALDKGSGRFLVEQPVAYRDCRGTADLYDVWNHTLIDWKTCSKSSLAGYIKNGPPEPNRIQIQLYAAGFQELGYRVDEAALFYLPLDGPLSHAWAWTTAPDRAIADAAIERGQALLDVNPYAAVATPGRECGYCDQYNPRATDLRLGCPGKKGMP
jgi:hypothetical protein